MTIHEQIDSFIAAHERDIVRDIARLVAVPSVRGEAAPNAPFGAESRRALDTALEIARELGLSTGELDGYVGWASLPGAQEDKYLATITHVDVVPAGGGWDGDPFTLREREGWLLGRGVIDDKGPSILCLYALKFLRESGVSLRYPIRALLGAAEETGMEDVIYFIEHSPAPVFCFSPDAEFPLCNGEKGHFTCELHSRPLSGRIVDFYGGLAGNAIPDEAFVLLRADGLTLPEGEHVTLSREGGLVRVTSHGVGGHASLPAGTRNAIGMIVDYLLANNVCEGEEAAFLRALRRLHSDPSGAALGVAADDGFLGALTIIGGTIRMENGALRQGVDSRYPTNTSGAAIADALQAALGDAGAVECVHDDLPFHIPAGSDAIRACLDAYREVTGEPAEPFTMGGGTYARRFPQAVSFGPERLGVTLPPFAGPMHGANEGVALASLLEALKIYILTLLKLENLEF